LVADVLDRGSLISHLRIDRTAERLVGEDAEQGDEADEDDVLDEARAAGVTSQFFELTDLDGHGSYFPGFTDC
jgi:hypothetical protein